MKPIIAFTIGDYNGIGPELALKAAINPSVKKVCMPILIGPINIFKHTANILRIKASLEQSTLVNINKNNIHVIDVGDGISADIQFGKTTKHAGKCAGLAIEKAVDLCIQNKISAMVTAPTSKEALNLAGYIFPGQTEMIALLSQSQKVLMMLISEKMRVGLVTIHTAVKNIATNISYEKIVEKISLINESLKNDFGITKPKIAVLALNPHAGENGIIGSEENDIIIPAIKTSNNNGVKSEGPFSADAFFANHLYKNFDAVLAMYHDQGLIPLKMSSFGDGVNYSAGLKLIRTSPDHGTAYDIAGKNKADISSMIKAVKLAVSINKNRHKL